MPAIELRAKLRPSAAIALHMDVHLLPDNHALALAAHRAAILAVIGTSSGDPALFLLSGRRSNTSVDTHARSSFNGLCADARHSFERGQIVPIVASASAAVAFTAVVRGFGPSPLEWEHGESVDQAAMAATSRTRARSRSSNGIAASLGVGVGSVFGVVERGFAHGAIVSVEIVDDWPQIGDGCGYDRVVHLGLSESDVESFGVGEVFGEVVVAEGPKTKGDEGDET